MQFSTFTLATIAAAIQALTVSAAVLPRGGSHTGVGTYYTQGGGIGSCGQAHADTDMIVAMTATYNAAGASCGKTVSITNSKTGVNVQAQVADLCPGCLAPDDIDFSVGVAQALDPNYENDGRIPMTWDFV